MSVTSVESVEHFQECLKHPYVVVKFTASWCGPCRRIQPEYLRLSVENGAVKFVEVDIEKVPKLSEMYKILAVPTFLFFQHGEVVPHFTFSGGNVDTLIKNLQELQITNANLELVKDEQVVRQEVTNKNLAKMESDSESESDEETPRNVKYFEINKDDTNYLRIEEESVQDSDESEDEAPSNVVQPAPVTNVNFYVGTGNEGTVVQKPIVTSGNYYMGSLEEAPQYEKLIVTDEKVTYSDSDSETEEVKGKVRTLPFVQK